MKESVEFDHLTQSIQLIQSIGESSGGASKRNVLAAMLHCTTAAQRTTRGGARLETVLYIERMNTIYGPCTGRVTIAQMGSKT